MPTNQQIAHTPPPKIARLATQADKGIASDDGKNPAHISDIRGPGAQLGTVGSDRLGDSVDDQLGLAGDKLTDVHGRILQSHNRIGTAGATAVSSLAREKTVGCW